MAWFMRNSNRKDEEVFRANYEAAKAEVDRGDIEWARNKRREIEDAESAHERAFRAMREVLEEVDNEYGCLPERGLGHDTKCPAHWRVDARCVREIVRAALALAQAADSPTTEAEA